MYIFELLSLCNTDIYCQGDQRQDIPYLMCGSITVVFVANARINTSSGKLTIIGTIA